MLMKIFAIFYVLLFFASVIYSVVFQLGKESRDERGQKILSLSYTVAFPFLLPAWLIIDSFLAPDDLEIYRRAIWFMVTGVYIIHAVALFFARRRL